MKLPKTYVAADYENKIYELWENRDVFKADPSRKAERFSISMPPPNATGTLHVGHALGIAVQDIMIRYTRMQGRDALWLPGTDHAALATNAIMEKQLAEEGTNKHEVGREEFVRRLKEFIAASQDRMRSQIRAMGASCDWSRERYTLDDALNRCVNETFVKMYKDGLIYRGHRIVNWDPKLETTVADDEVVRIEEKAPFYTFQYGPFQIGTARPETKFGDKYVVMHPDDKRYKKYKHGQTFETEWINGKITATVIKDRAVDSEFGTGVMTITPWHDHTDFEIAERHSLEKEQIIDFDGRLLPIAGEFAGMEITKARPLIVEKLKSKGLLVDIDKKYVHNIAVNDRGKGIIEPQIKLQWFVDVNRPAINWKGDLRTFKEVMRAVIEDGDIKITPRRFDKTYYHWIDNLRDWCISRQIWWGHRMPVWYKKAGGKDQIYVGLKPPEGAGWHQDEDTLDTWFSSALWTWSTLVDPELAKDYSLSLEDILQRSIDFRTYHPTSVMETGWDILFFWVARMILATTYMTGQVPFKNVYLHGLVRSETGKKMSKSSPETMIDPLEVIPKYGTDALRLALIGGIHPGNDSRMSIAKIVGQRNFCNKLWNIARYVESVSNNSLVPIQPVPKETADFWILTKLQQLTEAVSADLDNYRFSEAYDKIYHGIWDDLADWYIEASKIAPDADMLKYCLSTVLKLSHPFAPFVTETIWQQLFATNKSLLATQKWPTIPQGDNKRVREFNTLQKFISEVHYLTSELQLKKPRLVYSSSDIIEKYGQLIKQMGRLGEIKQGSSGGLPLVTVSGAWLDVDHKTIDEYLKRLKARLKEQGSVVKKLEDRLANKFYVKNAPAEIVNQTKSELESAKSLFETLQKNLRRFSS